MSASELKVIPLGDGRYLVRDGARQQLAYAVAAEDTRWVFLDGRVFTIETEARTRRRARGHDEAALSSPMPATVVQVKVGPGQSVTQGDVLVTLEAMKMELAVQAPRDGLVTAVRCRKGELVQPGVPLVDME